MRGKWYSDNRDLIKWSVLLLLARRAGADRIIQIALLTQAILARSRLTVSRIKYLRKCCPISATCETSPGFLGTEGWSFHSDLMIVSPLTFKKRWTKSAVIRLFNESENARRIGVAYPETSLSGKSVSRIITDVAALAAHGTPKRPLQRTRVHGARPVAERKR